MQHVGTNGNLSIDTTIVYSHLADATMMQFPLISCQGSSRSGKTYNILIFLLMYAIHNPNVRISVVRKTLPALRGSALMDFEEILSATGLYLHCRINKTRRTYWFKNGSFFEFFPADDAQKVKSMKRDILFAVEANELKYDVWKQLTIRTSRFSIIDYNPSFTEEHWIWQANTSSNTYHFVTTYKDNPFLPQTIIDELESLRDQNKSLWTVYGLGQYAKIEGLIFPEYVIIDEMPSNVRRRGLGLDFGYTIDPTALIDCGHIGYNVYLDELCYKHKMGTRDIANEISHTGLTAYADNSNPRLIDEIRDLNCKIKGVKKGAGSIKEGIFMMQQMKLHITQRSVNTIKEINNYVYKEVNGKFTNEPVDFLNHAIDGWRYWTVGNLKINKKTKKMQGYV